VRRFFDVLIGLGVVAAALFLVSGSSPAPVAAATSAPGYWLATADGQVLSYGAATSHGSMAGQRLAAPVVAMAGTPDGQGYWLVATDGGVFSFGTATPLGSLGGLPLNAPIVGLASAPQGQGYWMVARDGGVFAFGAAQANGSMGGHPLNQPVVGMTAGRDDSSYRLVAADGGIFSFGAPFFGSMGGHHLNAPIVGMAADGTGGGYWMVAADGGIFAFGDAGFYGSMGGQHLNRPIIGMVASPTGLGYWMIADDGGVFAFGDADFLGSTGGQTLGTRVVALAPYVAPPPPPPPTTTTGAPTTTTTTTAPTTTTTTTEPTTTTTTTTTAPPPPDPDVLAAGDIASCAVDTDEATAQLLDANPNDPVLALGDNAYESGTADEFNTCYDPTWGRAKSRTHPVLGNHDTITPAAAGYYGYYGTAAGTQGQGYYSFDVGAWHIVALNSEKCFSTQAGCPVDSTQLQWLDADLKAHTNTCTLVYWHEPRWASGDSSDDGGDNVQVAPLWDTALADGADVALVGHFHAYERFAPMLSDGTVDAANGMREFVVGTGGRSLFPQFMTPHPGSEARNDDTFGVLKLSLHATTYDWRFLPIAGGSYTDSGSGACH
jgi:hypothetical protein